MKEDLINIDSDVNDEELIVVEEEKDNDPDFAEFWHARQIIQKKVRTTFLI